MISNSDDDLLKPREVADLLGVSPATVGRWARDGVLKPAAYTPGGQRRYRRGDLPGPAAQEPPEQRVADAVRLYDQGWSIRRVGEEFGYDYSAMRRLLLRHTRLRRR
jgi:excisionase family DNA binding protein